MGPILGPNETNEEEEKEEKEEEGSTTEEAGTKSRYIPKCIRRHHKDHQRIMVRA